MFASYHVQSKSSVFVFILCFTVCLRLYFRQTHSRVYDHAHNTTFHSDTHNAEGNLRSHRYNVRGETGFSYPKDFQPQMPTRALRRIRALAPFASVRQNRSHLLRKNLNSRHLQTQLHGFALLQAQELHRLRHPKGLPTAPA